MVSDSHIRSFRFIFRSGPKCEKEIQLSIEDGYNSNLEQFCNHKALMTCLIGFSFIHFCPLSLFNSPCAIFHQLSIATCEHILTNKTLFKRKLKANIFPTIENIFKIGPTVFQFIHQKPDLLKPFLVSQFTENYAKFHCIRCSL